MEEGPHPREGHGHGPQESREQQAGQEPPIRPVDPDRGGSPERQQRREGRQPDAKEPPDGARHPPVAAYRRFQRNSVVTPPNASVAA